MTDNTGRSLRAVRFGAWVGIMAVVLWQGWASRFTMSPDGMSYLDLSDAVVSGHLGAIVNSYWSPLYPALIGFLRAVLRPAGAWEFATVHLLNVLMFAASIGAFEYFLTALSARAEAWGRDDFRRPWGLVAAYTFFAAMTITMVPLNLPTPDLIVTATVFATFGALLHVSSGTAAPRTYVVLGSALVIGSLAKSFLIPWSFIALVVAWVAARRGMSSPRKGGSIAGVVLGWAVVVGAWCAILSAHEHRITFGETGRLTYVWAMDPGNTPSDEAVPPRAASPGTDSILKGLAALPPDARGTNPIWFDPARWYAGQPLKWSASRALLTIRVYLIGYITLFAPYAFLVVFGLASATRAELREGWRRGAVVFAPSVIALVAYAIVLVATRYIAPFITASLLVIWISFPWPKRIPPIRPVVATLIALAIIPRAPQAGPLIAVEASLFAAVAIAWLARARTRTVMITFAVVGAFVLRAVMFYLPVMTLPFAGIFALALGALANGTDVRGEGEQFSNFYRTSMTVAASIMLAIAVLTKYSANLNAGRADIMNGQAKAELEANALRQAGLAPGDRAAVIGSPFTTYWARLARVQIAGVVPPLKVPSYYEAADADQRAAILNEFRTVGAEVVVSESAPADSATGWTKLSAGVWVKGLRLLPDSASVDSAEKTIRRSVGMPPTGSDAPRPTFLRSERFGQKLPGTAACPPQSFQSVVPRFIHKPGADMQLSSSRIAVLSAVVVAVGHPRTSNPTAVANPCSQGYIGWSPAGQSVVHRMASTSGDLPVPDANPVFAARSDEPCGGPAPAAAENPLAPRSRR